MPQQSSTEAATEQISADVSTAWATVDNLVDGFIALLPKMVIALVVFIIFWIIARVVQSVVKRATRERASANVGLVLGRLAKIGLLFAGLVVAAGIVVPGIGGGDLLQLLGVGGVAIGFAFRDILQNFLAGILILLRQPFRIGDQIIFGDYEGTVEEIETRATFVRTYDGRRVVIPNGEIYTNAVLVNTAHQARRSEYDVGIGYGDDLREAARVMLEAVRSVEGVLEDPAPDVLTVELAGSSVNLRARWWTRPRRADVLDISHEVITAIKEALDNASIDMPFPTQVTLVHDQTEETDGDRTRQREGWPAGESPPEPRPLAATLAALADALGAQNGGAQAGNSRSGDEDAEPPHHGGKPAADGGP